VDLDSFVASISLQAIKKFIILGLQHLILSRLLGKLIQQVYFLYTVSRYLSIQPYEFHKYAFVVFL